MAARINTVRDHQERLNKVLLHIQAHPDVPYSLTQLARVACFSPFHFHRLFVAYVGEPLNVHLRRLRLERAAQQLCLSRRAVTDIALDAGYETSPAFNKAFQQLFRVSPTEFRQTRPSVISSTLKLQSYTPSAKSMKPKIITRPTKQLVFVRRTGSYGQSASEAWEAVCHFAYSRQLVKPGREFIGISHDDPQITAEDKLRYDACITVSGARAARGRSWGANPGGRHLRGISTQRAL